MRGYIQKRRLKNGSFRYLVRVDLGPDPATGERRQPSQTHRTRKEAEAALARWLAEIERGTAVDGTKMTVGEYLVHWLETYRSNLRVTTYRSYEQLVRVHVRPALGGIPLQKLQPSQLQAFYTAKLIGGRADGRAGGLSPRTVRYIHAVVREALAQAVRWQYVARNVADATEPPKAERPPIAYWTPDQVRHFLGVAAVDGYGPVWLVALTTGLRRGELLGLRWTDIDLDDATLRVRRSLVEVGGVLAFHEPKTKSGRRTVTLLPACVEALRTHRAAQAERLVLLGDARPNHDLVFAIADGGPIVPRNLVRRFKELTAAAGLPPITLHALRHTHATLLLQGREHPKVVSERLGHASVAITLDTYSHVLPDMQREAAVRLQAALFGG